MVTFADDPEQTGLDETPTVRFVTGNAFTVTFMVSVSKISHVVPSIFNALTFKVVLEVSVSEDNVLVLPSPKIELPVAFDPLYN